MYNVTNKVAGAAEKGRTLESVITQQLDAIARRVPEQELLIMVPVAECAHEGTLSSEQAPNVAEKDDTNTQQKCNREIIAENPLFLSERLLFGNI